MNPVVKSCSIWMCAILACLVTTVGFAADAEKDAGFAETKVVLQISDADPDKQTLVLNVANNLIKHYGQDDVKVEIVAFGPGLRLLFAENDNTGRIAELVSRDVKFSACSNTVRNMGKILGAPPKLNTNAVTVDAGVVRIVDLVAKGYTLVKP